jgi:predicted nucleotidyltransferase
MPSPDEIILELLFKYPTRRFSYREIERQTGLSIGTVSKYVPDIVLQDHAKVEVMPNAKYVTAVPDSERFVMLKRIANMKRLYTSGLIDHLATELRPIALVLFGSFGKGTDFEDSDIDICVIGGRKKEIDLRKFEKKLAREIKLVELQNLERCEPEFRQAVANGVVLHGQLILQEIHRSGKSQGHPT